MAGPRRAEVLRHSILDRLIGDDEGPPRGGDLRIGVEDLRRVIRRDLEWLLNSRIVPDERLWDHEEASKSVLAYGLTDLASFSVGSQKDSQTLCEMIARVVRNFEPRFAKRSIKVDFVPSTDTADLQMHFRITAMIQVDPIREAVTFDTSLDRASGSVTIRDGE